MLVMAGDVAVESVIALERELLKPSVRGSVEALDALLDPEFREIGASGRLWTRDDVLQALPAETTGITASDEEMGGRRLTDDLVLLTYITDEAGRRARRSSLWRLDEELGWRLLHHQGTLIP